MGELPPRTVHWFNGEGQRLPTMRAVHRRVVKDARAGADPMFFEVRCPYDKYLRLHMTVRNQVLPYWVWRARMVLAKARFYARIAVMRKCPQCTFDENVRDWYE